jgi:hypothetical protein
MYPSGSPYVIVEYAAAITDRTCRATLLRKSARRSRAVAVARGVQTRTER